MAGTKVFVKTLLGKIIVIECTADDTVEVVKEKIEKEHLVPPMLQRLIFNGLQLDEDKARLSLFHIQPTKSIEFDSTIHLILHRGVAPCFPESAPRAPRASRASRASRAPASAGAPAVVRPEEKKELETMDVLNVDQIAAKIELGFSEVIDPSDSPSEKERLCYGCSHVAWDLDQIPLTPEAIAVIIKLAEKKVMFTLLTKTTEDAAVVSLQKTHSEIKCLYRVIGSAGAAFKASCRTLRGGLLFPFSSDPKFLDSYIGASTYAQERIVKLHYIKKS
ncbi:MAG: putative polyubiquitin-A isoform X3 [Harvfovirus sp.]|uniref:Putative polyubiquitin-A isoform X3 n=1 Tax=Harvfovirus sp. TaxID=2487768 RepID=A0A3G5A6I8_9VIRU|nr:MAG: putative polyubiquitin-A isoform X3 [Harvfovirus sp.]